MLSTSALSEWFLAQPWAILCLSLQLLIIVDVNNIQVLEAGDISFRRDNHAAILLSRVNFIGKKKKKKKDSSSTASVQKQALNVSMPALSFLELGKAAGGSNAVFVVLVGKISTPPSFSAAARSMSMPEILCPVPLLT